MIVCSTSCHSLHEFRKVEFHQIYAYHKKVYCTHQRSTYSRIPKTIRLSNQTLFSICFGYFDLEPSKEQTSKVKYLFLAVQDRSIGDLVTDLLIH